MGGDNRLGNCVRPSQLIYFTRIAVLSTLAFALVFGCLLTFSRQFSAENEKNHFASRSSTPDFKSQLIKSFKTKNLETNLRYFTQRPHFLGSARNNELGRYIARKWNQYGFDRVEMPSYDVLVNLPDKDNPSKVEMLDVNGKVIFRSQLKEKPVTGEEDDIIPPGFLTFTANGSVTGEVVYANFGTPEDLRVLHRMGVSLKGKIVLVRMGRIYRGNKIFNVAPKGAAGVILYMDPAQFAPEGPNKTFPSSWWLPETGTQRGSATLGGYPGDPLTPGFPAVEGIYRQPLTESLKKFPPVPSLVLSYGDAVKILRRMKGPIAPEKWQGGLNMTYRIGPGFKDTSIRLQMEVHNIMETRTIYNVIATITGREEPDRYILIGNHRDAWVFGGSDPSSGTSILMELSRGLGELLSSGWRPRRTIMLCSWDGEEILVFGSTEWVEENAKILSIRAVAYLNTDVGVSGNFSFNVDASALLQDVVLSTAEDVSDPMVANHSKSLYDVMLENDKRKHVNKRVSVKIPVSGSDYGPFYKLLGVNVADFAYIFGDTNYRIRRSYPVYHSVYDTFEWMKTFVDPEFTKHLALTKYAGLLLLRLADSRLLPLSTFRFANLLKENFKRILEDNTLVRENVNLQILSKAVDKFSRTVNSFEVAKKELEGKDNFINVRVLNDQMTQLEKMFLEPKLITSGAKHNRNVLYAPDIKNIYQGIFFPRIQEAILRAKDTNGWEGVKKEISVLLFCVNSAIKLLTQITPPTDVNAKSLLVRAKSRT